MGAEQCLKYGASVILLNRPSSRAEAAISNILYSVENKKDVENRLQHIDCDLTSFESVRKAAHDVKAYVGNNGIDILCNNAGIMSCPDEATVDGCDIQMQTNHLSHF